MKRPLLTIGLAVTMIGCVCATTPPSTPGSDKGGKSTAKTAKDESKVEELPEVKKYFAEKMLTNSRKVVCIYIMDHAVTEKDREMIKKSRTVQELTLMRAPATDADLKAFSENANIQGISLFFSADEVTDDGIKALTKLKKLESLLLQNCPKVTDAGLKEIAKLPALQSLSLQIMKLDGSFLEPLAESKTFREMTLMEVAGLSEKGIEYLSKLKVDSLRVEMKDLDTAKLKSILSQRVPPSFTCSVALLDDELFQKLAANGWLLKSPYGKKLTNPAQVEEIVLTGAAVGDKGFEAALNCVNATSLHLNSTKITDASLKKLNNFKKLKYLALDHDQITNEGLEALTTLPIEHLSLEQVELNEKTFTIFGRMKSLKELWLKQPPGSKVAFKDDWLKHLEGASTLRWLDLGGNQVSDEAVPFLVKLPTLETLSLSNSGLTDKGFLELVKHPKLSCLDLNNTKVKKTTFEKAKKEYPKKLFFGFGLPE